MNQAERIEAIARTHLRIETLQARGSDGLDFYDLGVCSVKAALEAAFLAGQSEGKVTNHAAI